MKKGFLLILICAIQLVTYSQKKITDSTYIIGITTEDEANVSTSVNAEGFKNGSDFIIPPHSNIFIIGVKSFKMKSGRLFDYYEIAYRGNKYFIYRENVILVSKDCNFENLLTSNINESDSFRNYNISLSEGYHKSLISDVYKFIESCKSKGIVILKNSIYDESEYTEGTSFTFEIQNLSNKTIKYVTFNIVGYNSVNDKVTDRGSSQKSVKGVGPIEKNISGSYSFKYVWFTDLVETFKVISVKLEYMDGSIKVIENPKLITLTSKQLSLLTEK